MISKRFGSVEPFTTFESLSARRGLPVASEEFFKAVLQYGTFDGYDIYCPDAETYRKMMARLEEILPEPELRKRVQPSLQIALQEALNARDYTVFHTFDAMKTMPALARLRNRYAKTPFAITATTLDTMSTRTVGQWVELAMGGLQPYDALVAPTMAAAQTLRGQLAATTKVLANGNAIEALRMETLPFGVDTALFEQLDRETAREMFHIPKGWTMALSVGTISHRAKQDWSPTLELLARMYATGQYSDLMCVIAGSGDPVAVDTLQTLIGELGLQARVLVFANFKPEVKQQLFAAADFFMAPVDNPASTNAITTAEAMAAGLPVLASGFGASRNLVEDGVSGFILKSAALETIPEFIEVAQPLLSAELESLYLSQLVSLDLDKMESSLHNLIRNPQMREQMGLAARAKAKKLAWPEVVREYEAMWTQLSAEAQRRGKGLAPATQELSAKPLEGAVSALADTVIGEGTAFKKSDKVAPNSLLTRYDDVRVCIFEPLEAMVMEAMATGPQTLQQLRDMGQKHLGVNQAYVDFHAVWLLKHGRIALA